MQRVHAPWRPEVIQQQLHAGDEIKLWTQAGEYWHLEVSALGPDSLTGTTIRNGGSKGGGGAAVEIGYQQIYDLEVRRYNEKKTGKAVGKSVETVVNSLVESLCTSPCDIGR